MYIYIYIHMHIYTYVYIYLYICIYIYKGTLLSHMAVHSVLFSVYEASKLLGMHMAKLLLDDLKYKDHDDVRYIFIQTYIYTYTYI
jgi:hypothetical protein